eukprot:g31234.t1
MEKADVTASLSLPSDEEDEFRPRCFGHKKHAMVKYMLPVSEAESEQPDLVQKWPRKGYRTKNRVTSQDLEGKGCSDWNEVSQVDLIEYEFPDRT